MASNDQITIIYLTTKGLFTADGLTGSHSTVYAFHRNGKTFGGPLFVAPAYGLPAKVDGLQYEVTP